ncbi:MAG: hypothetical protein B0W54_22435 [Cellvibrio sp. 79]|nr:MAG: hypothetical protein B0W54_22435 [Cellvibrio sp. 79]
MLNPVEKRPLCQHCLRPLRTCICSLVSIHDNRIELLILQDKAEATNTKNTAGLLHMSLKNSQLYTCDADEAISPSRLNELLFSGHKLPLLLYPPTIDALALGLEMPAQTPAIEQITTDKVRLIVIDATWRKSRKMIYLNYLLQRLPRITLENPPESLYLIRKADNKNQLSTLEASCYALQQLEQGRVDYTTLLASMREFVARQTAFRPV